MKKGRFTEQQIVSALKKQEAGIAVKEIMLGWASRSFADYVNWKMKISG